MLALFVTAASALHGCAHAQPCVSYPLPTASALYYPNDLGIQWTAGYDTQWWLGNFVSTSDPSRQFGVELSIARVTTNASNCSPSAGVVLAFVGISDSHTQEYLQHSMVIQLDAQEFSVGSTSAPYNVSILPGPAAPGAATKMAIGVEQSPTTPQGSPRSGQPGVTQPTKPPAQNSQTIFVRGVPGLNASFELHVATDSVLQNELMADKGWLYMVVSFFCQVAQPELVGSARLHLPTGTVEASGAVYLQHIWGTDPFAKDTGIAGNADATRPPFRHLEAGSGQPHWTWMMARLPGDLSLSLTKFVAAGASAAGASGGLARPHARGGQAPQYLNLVNRSSGENRYLSGNEFNVTLDSSGTCGWTSPASGIHYARCATLTVPPNPAGTVAPGGVVLKWRTLVPDNEHHLAGVTTYYEAASNVKGVVAGVAVAGVGYLEHRVE